MSKSNRADYRLIQRLMKIQSKKSPISPKKTDFEKVLKTFLHFKGSWERLFQGSVEDISLLKKIIRVGIDRELFTKSDGLE